MSAARMIRICRDEQAAILRGELHRLSSFEEEKRRALQGLQDHGDAKQLAAAIAASEQSDRLLSAVRDGLRRAQSRLAAARHAPESRTYDAAGATTRLGGGPTGLARKA